MRLFRHRSPLASFSTVATCTLGLALLTATNPLVAQVQADYPLLVDLLDASNNYGPITLSGNPPPAMPNNGVCVNGIYYYNTGGQDVRTPLIPTLDTTDFQFGVEFMINQLPSNRCPVVMGGHSYRWLGIYLQSNGIVGFKHNNSNLAWSTTTLTTGVWYHGMLKYEAGTAELLINGRPVHQLAVGPLNDGNNKNFTTNDFSSGLAFNGCIRNLVIANDTTIGGAVAVPYGEGCPGSAGTPSLTPTNLPQLGALFSIDAANLEPNATLAFLSIGLDWTTSPLGPLPLSLQPYGLGAGCDLLVSADATVLFPVAGGAGTFYFVAPSSPAVVGISLFFQCGSIDGGATGGFALSNAVGTTIG